MQGRSSGSCGARQGGRLVFQPRAASTWFSAVLALAWCRTGRHRVRGQRRVSEPAPSLSTGSTKDSPRAGRQPHGPNRVIGIGNFGAIGARQSLSLTRADTSKSSFWAAMMLRYLDICRYCQSVGQRRNLHASREGFVSLRQPDYAWVTYSSEDCMTGE